MKLLRHLGIIAGLLAVAGCEGIGEGNRIESIRLQLVTAPDSTTPVIYQCLRNNLQAIATFTNGLEGDVTTRVNFTSSNPALISVSNGDQPVPGNETFNFVSGTLTPAAGNLPGAMGGDKSLITAEFAGITANIEVEVRKPDSITITPNNPILAPGSSQILTATAVLDGVSQNITQAGDWVIQVPNTNIASIAQFTGVVTVPATADTMNSIESVTARLRLSACDGFDFDDSDLPAGVVLTNQIDVSSNFNIVIQREPGFTQPLVVGTSEFIRTIASFNGDPRTQDLSFQSVYTSADPTRLLHATGLLTALDDTSAPVAITSTFGAELVNGSANPNRRTAMMDFEAQDATLASFVVSPAPAMIPELGATQFSALGTFNPTGGGASFTQPVSRHLLWSVSDTTLAGIGNGNSLGFVDSLPASVAGRVQSIARVDADTDITVTAVPITIAAIGTAAAIASPATPSVPAPDAAHSATLTIQDSIP